MFKRLFSLLFLFVSSLIANDAFISTLENDPSAFIEGRVNALTGRPSLYEEDLVIQGVEPIRISRTYVDSLEGDWRFTVDFARILDTEKPYRWVIWEKDRCPILYKKIDTVKFNGERYTRCEPSNLEKGFSNTARGAISSRTNLKNNRVLFDKEFENLIVNCADGTMRTYRKVDGRYREYQLLSEHLPNGNWILYEYKEVKLKNKEKRIILTSIRTTNPTLDKTYARADFVYEDPKGGNKHFFIVGSDGQQVEYRFQKNDRGWQAGSLESVVSTSAPDKSFGYIDYRNKYEKFKGNYEGVKEHRVRTLAAPLNRQIQLDYYKKEQEEIPGRRIHLDRDDWNNGRMYDDPRRDCVKVLLSPIGSDPNPQVTHSFVYEPVPGKSYFEKTSVYDIDGNRTDYFSDWYSRLKQIERFSKEGKRLNAEAFQWGYNEQNGYLICKTHLDADLKPLFFIRYVYDGRGNVVEEKFCGNLTGGGAPIAMDQCRYPFNNAPETYSKKFRYSSGEPNLLIEEEHDSGLRIVYSYLTGTDLLLSKLTYDKDQLKLRQFFEYDPDHILIREIEDDGSSASPNDFSGVTVRTIRKYSPLQSGPYIGLPHVIEEKYWEKGREVLLRKTVLTYTTGAKIEKKEVYDAEGELRFSLEIKYDEKGRPIEKTNPIGQIETFSYDLCGNQKTHRDFSKRVFTSIDYDFSNRPTVVNKEGNDGIRLQNSFTYDRKHNLIMETDPQGSETCHRYDVLGQCIETQLPKIVSEKGTLVSPTIQQQYDSAGNQVLKIDAEGNSTNITYNAYGKPILIVHPDGAKEEYVYFLDGSLKTYINPKGISTSYTYDFLGRPVRKAIFSSTGRLLSEESFVYKGKCLISKTDAEGFRTTYEYDGAGRKISEEREGEKTSFTYDSLSRPYKVQKGDLVVVTEYDLLDRVLEERSESSSGELLRLIAYEYDEAGNQKTVIQSVSGEKTYEKRSYDSLGRLVEKIDPLGYTETIAYNDFFQNEFGQKVLQKTHTDPMGLKTIETFNSHSQVAKIEKNKDKSLLIEEKIYNRNDLLTFQTDTIFSPSSRKIFTRWTYDSRNRLKSLTEAEGTAEVKTTRYSYTPCGELSETTKPNGSRLVYDYNDLGFLVSLTSSDGTVQHQMDYNRLGHLIQSDNLSRTVDANGRILKETFPKGYCIENAYDNRGQRKKAVIPQANCLIEYKYDAAYLKQVSRKTLDGRDLYAHSYVAYDLSGNLLESALIGNLGQVKYSVDPLSRKTQVNAPRFSQEVQEFDPVGNIRRMQTQNDEISYSYDELYQLTSESGPFAHDYRYDSLNNRLQKDGENYKINDLNQDLSHFEYDQNGNPILQGDRRYTYDTLDRLIRIDAPSFSQTFKYDSLHRCLEKTTAKDGVEEVRYFLYDGQNEIGSLDEDLNPLELRILGKAPHAEIDAAVAIELLGKTYAPVHDLQGNIAALLPLGKENPTFYRYSAFGEEKKIGPSANPWRFASKRSDADSGLVYYGRRFYCPEFGRWMTPDPSGFTDGMNLYAFVHNDPLTHFDEYGLEDFGQMMRMMERHRDIKNYLKGEYKFEDHYYRFVPPGYSLNTSSGKPFGEIVLFTGIRTTYQEHCQMVHYTSKLGGDVPVHGIHMPTHGAMADIEKCYSTLNTEMNSTILHGERYFREASERVGHNGKILVLAHSAGAMNAYFSSMRLPKEIRNKIIPLAFAPAKLLPWSDFENAKNFRSSGFDAVMLYHQIWNKVEYKGALNSGMLLTLPAHSEASKVHDHPYMSPTFQIPIIRNLDLFIRNYNCR